MILRPFHSPSLIQTLLAASPDLAMVLELRKIHPNLPALQSRKGTETGTQPTRQTSAIASDPLRPMVELPDSVLPPGVRRRY